MNVNTLKPILNTSLPRTFRKIRLELAREPGHPDGDSRSAYIMIAPLTHDGKLDGKLWHEFRDACRVVRQRPGDSGVHGLIKRTSAGRWFFQYDDNKRPDETGYHFSDERFVVDEYVSVVEADTPHTFRVVSVEAL